MSTSYRDRLAQWPEDKRQQLAKQLDLASTDEQLVAHITGDHIDNDSLKEHLAERLPAFMIPSHIVQLETLPKTANGKVDRQALTLAKTEPKASSQASLDTVAHEASNRFEIGMATLWADVLNVDAVGIDENFFELGGNSLIMIKLIGKIQETFGIKLPMTAIGAAPTVRQLVRQIDEDDQAISWPFLVPIREDGAKPPFFMVHGLGGGIFDYYRLKPHLPEDHPFYAVQAPLTPYDDLIQMATAYREAIQDVQPEGPYHLGGYCLGAVVAFEIAQQLIADGKEVSMLALIESAPPRRPLSSPSALGTLVKQRLHHFMTRDATEKRAFIRNKATGLTKRFRRAVGRRDEADRGFAIEAEDYFDLEAYPPAYREIVRVHFRALRDYKPKPYPGTAIVYHANDDHWSRQDPTLGWADWITADLLDAIEITGDHHTTLQHPHVADLGRKLAETLISTNQS